MKQDWNYIEELGRISTGTGIVIEATGGEKSECQDALQLAALAPAMLEALQVMTSTISQINNSLEYVTPEVFKALEVARAVIIKTKVTH
jgi:hypothetical protein